MNIAIRYFSKFGHSAKMAQAAGKSVGIEAHDVTVPLTEPVETLFLGSGVMLGKISPEMVSFINTLTPDKVKRVVCFGSCAIIKTPVTQMRKLLEQQGIQVDERSFTCKGSMGPLHYGHPNAQDVDNFVEFVRQSL